MVGAVSEGQGLSHDLAQFICGLETKDVPPPVRARARDLMLDALGVGLAGVGHPNFEAALAGTCATPGNAGPHQVIGRATTLSLPSAVMVNGLACHVIDFDDTHTASIVHGSAIFAPLVLALGQEVGATGADVLTAFVAGWEVAARVGIASGNSFHERGFHTTAVAGVFGAVAAAGKLLKLTPRQMTHAFGLAGSRASGINEFLINASSSKGYHVGWAAQNGVTTAYLARAGATGPDQVFEGARGIFATHGLPDQCNPAAIAAALGADWQVARVSIKPYPCCHFAHGAIDCALELRAGGVSADQVAGMHAIIDAVAAGFVCTPEETKFRPSNAYGAKFSLPFLVATALIDGRVDRRSFTDEALHRASILQLARRTTFEPAAKGSTGFPNYYPGHLQLTLTDGRTLEKQVKINRGNPDAPLGAEALEAKLMDCAGPVLGAAGVQQLAAQIRNIDDAADTRAITACLAGR